MQEQEQEEEEEEEEEEEDSWRRRTPGGGGGTGAEGAGADMISNSLRDPVAGAAQCHNVRRLVKRLRVRLFSQLQPLEAWRPSACRSGTCGARGFQLHPT